MRLFAFEEAHPGGISSPWANGIMSIRENGRGRVGPLFGLDAVRTTSSIVLAIRRAVKPVTWTKWIFISDKRPQKGHAGRGKVVEKGMGQNGTSRHRDVDLKAVIGNILSDKKGSSD
ncbi:hypothetical protein KM043_008376 [Ampulex compressa]|nr:hypothetical protein KM043_008376 [Ampulex compressa]